MMHDVRHGMHRCGIIIARHARRYLYRPNPNPIDGISDLCGGVSGPLLRMFDAVYY
jgi:hypothetical protein